MFVFQDCNGHSHLIDSGEALRKAVGVPDGPRVVIVSDEAGRLISAGRNMSQLIKTESLVKSLRTDVESETDSDDLLIHELGREARAKKKFDRSEQAKATKPVVKRAVNARLILPKKSAGGQSAAKPTVNVKPSHTRLEKSLARSESRSGLLGLLDDLQALRKSYGLA